MNTPERVQRTNDAEAHVVSDVHGADQWSSLEQLPNDPEYNQWLEREFASGSSELADPLERRQFLKLMGASLALMGASGCYRPPEQKIVPYLEQPELLVAGRPLYFATALPFNGPATGLPVTGT